MMNRYELTYIIDTALEETARKELIEKVSALIADNGGEVRRLMRNRGARVQSVWPTPSTTRPKAGTCW